MIKDVLVHLDGSAEDECRLAYAEAIASLSDGHLTGAYANFLPDFAMPIDGGGAAAQIMGDLEEQTRAEGDGVCARLMERFARLGVPSEVRRYDAMPAAMGDRLALQARYSDLFVATRPYGKNGNAHWSDLVEAVLFGSRRGLFLVPPGRRPHGPIQTVLVAWQDTREAARAAGEALPFLQRATRTILVIVDLDNAGRDSKGAPGADIAKHLDRHGAKVEAREVASEGREVSEVLLDQARRMSADLIVMGAYGHSRLREWVLGGTTLEMLTLSEVPILVAH
jgi:nucleotide-binding universal stress UspA family protein